MKETAASEKLGHLTPFVGVWATKGAIKLDESGASSDFRAVDSYEWMPGGHFLLHRFNAEMPGERVQGIEVIGYDEASDSYPMHSFDSTGNASLMHARLSDGVWTFVGESIRFTGSFCNGGQTLTGVWEQRTDERADWRSWMDVELKKAQEE